MADSVYHANFHSQNPRSSRGPNAVRFGAASDAAAAAVAAELGNWTTGQLTSLYKRVGGDGVQETDPYPAGTDLTATAIVADATGAVWKVRFRNVGARGYEPAITAMLLGTAFVGPPIITALGAPPNLPKTGAAITNVLSVSIIQKIIF